jgi:hypothetical protein
MTRSGIVFIVLGLTGFLSQLFAQEEVRPSIAGEQASEASKNTSTPAGYNIRYGPVAFSVHAGLRTEFNDNVFWNETGARNDVIITPNVDLKAFYPISQLNSINLSLGVAYERYLRNTSLNTDTPLISPDSDLSLRLYAGDFAFKVHEGFSYQESLLHDFFSGSFFNLNNIGKLGRYDNFIGVSTDWDLHDMLVNFTYNHENFWINGSTFDYLDRASELFSSSVMFLFSPAFSAGLEAHASLNNFDQHVLPNHWRAGIGPTFQLTFSDYLQLHAGGGFDTIRLENTASGPSNLDTFYAYGQLTNRLNRYISQTLTVSQDNQLSILAVNLQGTHIKYNVLWNVIRNTDLSTYGGVEFYKESLGSLYNENFTVYYAGMNIAYHFGKRWLGSLSYNYVQKASDTAGSSFDQNRVDLGVTYSF